MGAYCTVSTFYANNLYNITTSTANTTTLNQYITKAEAVVNSYVAGKYTLPFIQVPELITSIAEDLVVARVWKDLYPNDNASYNDKVNEKYTDALDLLNKISDGTMQLTASNSVISSIKEDLYSGSHVGYPLPMDMDSEWNWGPAGQLVDQIEDARESADA